MNKNTSEVEAIIDKNFDQARALADRRDFFTLSLVFTVLAVAIQTAEFGEHEFQRFLEMLAWVGLFVSGISALLRVRMAPVYYVAIGYREKYRSWSRLLREYKGSIYCYRDGSYYEMSNEERLKSGSEEENNAVSMEEKAEGVSTQGSIQHEVHFWSLLIGLFLLGVSRAWVNLGS